MRSTFIIWIILIAFSFCKVLCYTRAGLYCWWDKAFNLHVFFLSLFLFFGASLDKLFNLLRRLPFWCWVQHHAQQKCIPLLKKFTINRLLMQCTKCGYTYYCLQDSTNTGSYFGWPELVFCVFISLLRLNKPDASSILKALLHEWCSCSISKCHWWMFLPT